MAPFPGLLLPIDPTVPNVPVPSCTILPCYIDLNVSAAAATNNTLVGFASAPNGRGTIGIFWSCLFTLYASFWSVLHLNIPSAKDSRATVMFRTVKWMIITAIAPEYTYLVANGQREMAKKALVQIEEVRKSRRDRSDRGPKWTITHTFFAEMGGFHLRYYRIPGNRTQSGWLLKHLPVSGIDIAYLLHKGIINNLPSITREEIKERSKADSFTKVVACCQLFWLVIQSIARACQNLPITQLELVTLLDAFCALLTYIAWFQKPYNLTSAAVIHIDVTRMPADIEKALTTKKYSYQIWTKDILARLDGSNQDRVPNAFPLSVGTDLSDKTNSDSYSDYGTPSYSYRLSEETTTEQQNSSENKRERQTEKRRFRRGSDSIKESISYREKTSDERQELYPIENPEDISLPLSNPIAAATAEEEAAAVENGDGEGEEEGKGKGKRKEEAKGEGEGEIEEGEGNDDENRPEMETVPSASQQHNEQGLPSFIPDSSLFPSPPVRRDTLASTGGPKLFNIGLRSPWIFTLLMCMSFGALHCIMWTRVFPTAIEQTLWRISSVAITLAVPLYLFCAYSGVASAKNTPTIVLFTGLYAMARLYVIVEAFVSLRAQPGEVYEDIDWTKFLPHF